MAHSKEGTFQKGHIQNKADYKKSTYQKEHIPKRAHSKQGTFQKEHIPKKAHSQKSTFQKEHIPNKESFTEIFLKQKGYFVGQKCHFRPEKSKTVTIFSEGFNADTEFFVRASTWALRPARTCIVWQSGLWSFSDRVYNIRKTFAKESTCPQEIFEF